MDTASGEYLNLIMFYLPRLCMHCRDAPCVEVCPTGACYQREDGIVMVDYDKCVGCKYCIVACPYGARYYNKEGSAYFAAERPNEKLGYRPHKLHMTEKCTLCLDRLESGKEPACVEVCPTGARHFGDLNDPQSEVSQLIARKHASQLLKDLGTEPSVYYLSP
jgi:molybdopterin-containing oxidoreductase family iron-sulfur binding subunit